MTQWVVFTATVPHVSEPESQLDSEVLPFYPSQWIWKVWIRITHCLLQGTAANASSFTSWIFTTRRGSDHTSTAHHRPHTERNNCENLFAHETSAHRSLNAKLKHQITANYLADSNVSLHVNIFNHCQPKKFHRRPLLISFNAITSKLYFLFLSVHTLSATWHQGMTALLLTLL